MATPSEKRDNFSGPEEENSGKSSIHPPTIIFAGFARLPANAAGSQILGTLALELEVDPYDMRIVDAACNCLPALGQKFLITLLVGRRLDEGFEEPIQEIRNRYISVTQRAMIAALEDVLKRYEQFQEARRQQGGSSEQSRKG